MRATATLLVILTTAALPLSAARADVYADFASASEDYAAAVAALEDAQSRYAALIVLGDPFTDISGRKKAIALQKEIREAQASVAAEQPAYDAARQKLNDALAPYALLEREARSALTQLDALKGGLLENHWRARETIQRDLARLYPPEMSDYARELDAAIALMRAGRPVTEVREQLNQVLGKDGASKMGLRYFIGAIEKSIVDGVQQSSQAGKRLYSEHTITGLKYVTAALRAMSLTDAGPLDPLKVKGLEQTGDVINMMIPVTKVDPISVNLQMQLAMVELFKPVAEGLQYTQIRENLRGLVLNASQRGSPYGDYWTGLSRDVLFGMPVPNPAILPSKLTFKPGEAITGKWWGSATYASDAWLGVMPAGTTDGDEVAADVADTDWQRIGDSGTAGQIDLEAPDEAGVYDLRMFTSDDGGKQVARVTITVKDQDEAGIDLTGVWIGVNYWCADKTYRTEVQVTQAAGEVIARKITGDPCVNAGNITFISRSSDGMNHNATCVVGWPDNPQSGRVAGYLSSVTQNSFTACRVNFTRRAD